MKIPPGGVCAPCRVLAIEKPKKKGIGESIAAPIRSVVTNSTFALWELTMTPHGRLRAGLRLKSSVASSTCPRCRFSMPTRYLEMSDMVLVLVSLVY